MALQWARGDTITLCLRALSVGGSNSKAICDLARSFSLAILSPMIFG